MSDRLQPSEELIRFFGPAVAKGLAWEKKVTTLEEAAKISDEELLSVRYLGKIALHRFRKRTQTQAEALQQEVEQLKERIRDLEFQIEELLNRDP